MPNKAFEQTSSGAAEMNVGISDKAIVSVEEDKLGRAPFAKAMADFISSQPAQNGFVVGLVGAWGSGKTSILNLVEGQLVNQGYTVVSFNPWLFSGTEQLISYFFVQLGAALGQKDDKKLRKAVGRLGEYAEVLEPLGPLPVIGPWAVRARAAGRLIGRFGKKEADVAVAARRKALDQALSGLDRPIIVVLDDIDRLRDTEIEDVVRLVRLTADFPNTVYLLAFDRKRLEHVLGGGDDEIGRSYLEKIVQVIQEVPAPHEPDLARMLSEGLDRVLQERTVGPSGARLLTNIFHMVIRPMFSTAREVQRYLNALPVTLQVIGDEIALPDLLALEAVRVLMPETYDLIPASASALLTPTGFGNIQPDEESRKATIAKFLHSSDSSEEVLKSLCRTVFPASAHLFENTGSYGSDWLSTWRRERRVAHPEVLRIYLERRLPEGVLPSSTVTAMFEALGDFEQLESLFGELSPDLVEHALERLTDYDGKYPSDAIPTALAVVSNQLPRLRRHSRGMGDFGADLAVARLVVRLMKAPESEADRVQAVEQALPRIPTLSARLALLLDVGHQEGRGSKLIPADVATDREQDIAEEVLVAPPNALGQERDLLRLLDITLERNESVARYRFDELISDDEFLLSALRVALGNVRGQTLGEVAVKVDWQLSWDWLEKLFGAERLSQRVAEVVAAIDTSTLDEDAARALSLAEKYSTGWRPPDFMAMDSDE